jgi:hypothetical protein
MLASAVYDGGLLEWLTTLLALSLGVLSILAGATEERAQRVYPESDTEWNPEGAPRLGDMLVNYGLISEDGLKQALAKQHGTNQRLGEILVELELVTHADLAQVLEEQLSRREGRLLWGAGDRLVS